MNNGNQGFQLAGLVMFYAAVVAAFYAWTGSTRIAAATGAIAFGITGLAILSDRG